jgi:hypothetical protein
MVDIETLASRHDAMVLSIGAVKIDPVKMELGETFYAVLPLKEQQRAGRYIDERTVRWWAMQTYDAQQVLRDKQTPYADLRNTLHAFNRYYGDSTGLWGNGVDFDNVILRHLFEQFDVDPAWSYRHNRCFRTMRALWPTRLEREGVHHNALDDAIYQAKCLLAMPAYHTAALNFGGREA